MKKTKIDGAYKPVGKTPSWSGTGGAINVGNTPVPQVAGVKLGAEKADGLDVK